MDVPVGFVCLMGEEGERETSRGRDKGGKEGENQEDVVPTQSL